MQYTVPSSPFQKLIDTARQARGLSTRDLSAALNDAGAPTAQSTVWTWLHHPNGYPHQRSFQKRHALALAQVLRLDADAVLSALDASRRMFTPKEQVAPAEVHDALRGIEEILRSGSTTYIKRATVLHLIQLARRGTATQEAE